MVANRYAVAGIARMAISMCGVILLITDLLFGGLVAGGTACGAVLAFGWMWSVRPLLRRAQLDDLRES